MVLGGLGCCCWELWGAQRVMEFQGLGALGFRGL